jgi:hypothetical protein
MDHRGHPKTPIRRADLPLDRLATAFIAASAEEAPGLAKALGALGPDGVRELGGVLGRLDTRGRGALEARERLLARRVLARLQRPDAESLALLNRILDYLDLNMSALIEEDELELCVEIIELFCRADSANDTLTRKELEMLYAVLRHLDRDGNGQLDPLERLALHKGLGAPAAFLAEHRQHNPHLRRVLASG